MRFNVLEPSFKKICKGSIIRDPVAGKGGGAHFASSNGFVL